jgi:methionine sulfoxide reductase heme-binding subunit
MVMQGRSHRSTPEWILRAITKHKYFNPALRGLVFLLSLVPLALICYRVVQQDLGPDPAKVLMHETGDWMLRFLVLVLLATPLRRYGWGRLSRYRRMLGLFLFFYASLHLLVFAQVYVGWSGQVLLEELSERPYVLVGFVAWLVLLPLAITSTQAWQRRLKRRWKALHQWVYLVPPLAVLHIYWLARSDYGNVLLYGLVFALLLGWRLQKKLSK